MNIKEKHLRKNELKKWIPTLFIFLPCDYQTNTKKSLQEQNIVLHSNLELS